MKCGNAFNVQLWLNMYQYLYETFFKAKHFSRTELPEVAYHGGYLRLLVGPQCIELFRVPN